MVGSLDGLQGTRYLPRSCGWTLPVPSATCYQTCFLCHGTTTMAPYRELRLTVDTMLRGLSIHPAWTGSDVCSPRCPYISSTFVSRIGWTTFLLYFQLCPHCRTTCILSQLVFEGPPLSTLDNQSVRREQQIRNLEKQEIQGREWVISTQTVHEPMVAPRRHSPLQGFA